MINWGYFKKYSRNPFVVHHNLEALIKNGIMQGAKYTGIRYSGEIMGCICVKFRPNPGEEMLSVNCR